MSIKAITRVWETSQQRGSALLMLLAIADYAKDDGTGAWPSLGTLARKTRMSRRNAIKIIQKLEEAGELTVRRKEGPHGTNFYDLTFQVVNPSSPPKSGASEPQFTSPSEPQFTSLVNPSSPDPSLNVNETSITANAENADPVSDFDELFPPKAKTPREQEPPIHQQSLAARQEFVMRAGRGGPETEEVVQALRDWHIPVEDWRQCLIVFHSVTGYSVPKTKSERKKYLYASCGIRDQADEFGPSVLARLYPIAWERHKTSGMTRTHPAAFWKLLRQVRDEEKQKPTGTGPQLTPEQEARYRELTAQE